MTRQYLRGLGYALIGLAVFYVACFVFVWTIQTNMGYPMWKSVVSLSMLGFGVLGLSATAVHIFRQVR